MDQSRYSATDFGQSFYPGLVWSRATWPDGRTQTTVTVDKVLAWGALGVAAYAIYARPQIVKQALRVVTKTPAVPWLLAGSALAAWRAYENGKKKALSTNRPTLSTRPRA
jgi:hypothetical protein